MTLDDRQYALLKRLQILTGVVPVGLFLVFHFLTNGQAIAGRDAFAAAVARIASLPALVAIEWTLIGVPLLAHLGIGIVLGMSRQGAFEPAFPNERSRWIQRVSGFYLAMYVVCHVWATRLSPDRLAGKRELFDLMADQLRDPVVFALQALAVIAAGVHFGLGLAALAGPNAFALPEAAAKRARLAGAVVAIVLTGIGLNAMLAFVWEPSQWLAAR